METGKEMRQETYLKEDDGPLELLGGRDESALLLNGQPIQFTYLREIGTTWRYQVAKNIVEADLIQDAHFQGFVRYGLVQPGSLVPQFQYLLSKLARGRYRLELAYIDTAIYLWEARGEDGEFYQADSYGALADIIETQAHYEEEVVEEYGSLLRQGYEPIVVTVTADKSLSTFILDGHHKFLAYSRLKKPARALVITKTDPLPISPARGLELLAQCGNQNTEYRNGFLDS